MHSYSDIYDGHIKTRSIELAVVGCCVVVGPLHAQAAAGTETVESVVHRTRHAGLRVPDRTLSRAFLAVLRYRVLKGNARRTNTAVHLTVPDAGRHATHTLLSVGVVESSSGANTRVSACVHHESSRGTALALLSIIIPVVV